MAKEPRGLGKGLSALLGEVPNADSLRKPVGYINKEVAGIKSRTDTSDVMRVPADMIVANPYQPRLSFNQESIEELSASIKALGLIQPITVRKVSDTQYQIISGERRFRACRMAGMTMIPAYVREANDRSMLEMAIVENIQREDLDPIEVAMSYQRLIDECQLTQEEMAERVGKKRTSVTNTLRLLKLPLRVQHDLKVGLLTVGHAKVLLSIESPELQEKLCDIVVKEDLSVRQLEEKVVGLAMKQGKPSQTKSNGDAITEEYSMLKDFLSSRFKREVIVRRSSSGKGSLTVKFDSDVQVRQFLDMLEDSVK